MTRALPSSASFVPPLRRAVLIGAAALAAFGLLAGAAQATEVDDPAAVEPAEPKSSTVTWGVRPADVEPHAAGRPNYAYAVEPGDSIADALVVTNYTEEPATFLVYAADAFTTADGVLDLVRQGEESVGVGAWVTTAESEITVPAGESAVVPFTLDVPRAAEPGDHAGGIVTSLITTRQEQGINVDRRLGSRIHVRVDGELAPAVSIEQLQATYDGTLNPFGAGTAGVTFSVVNTGNTRLAGDATVRVAGPFGLGARAEEVTLPELLPGERTEIDLQVAEVLPLLRLGAEVKLTSRAAGETAIPLDPVAAAVGALAVPWSLLVLLLAAAGLVFIARRRRRLREEATERRIAEAVAAARGEDRDSAVGSEVGVPHPA